MRTTQRLLLSLLALLSFSLFTATASADSAPPDEINAANAVALEPSAIVQDVKELPAWQQSLDDTFGSLNTAVSDVVFYPIPMGTQPDGTPREIPFAVIWLVLGAIFFTIRMRFISFRGFKHAIDVVRGKYTDPNSKDAGEVSHFQALTTALSATVGLGNIAGVAIAVSIGGPGATFWMIAAGLLGMSSKFVECTLGQMYRQERADGQVMGGAMYYLSNGLGEMKLSFLGKPLAVLFAVLCIGGSIAGGNSFQVNQSLGAVGETIPWLAENGWAYGAIMTILAGVVIIGGIKRIANVAEKIVPTMCA
ncbi:MAG: AGCS family alanine or glycine:cation symporter, partial [Planctomycetota bacterium]